MLYKDSVLAERAEQANVAQFVSFGPGKRPLARHVCIRGFSNTARLTLERLIAQLLHVTLEHSVNVRAFDPEQPKAHEFIYGLKSTTEVVAHVRRLAAAGLYTIVNETVDVGDGGVSGVAYGGVIEFAPDDTPRCVEKPGTASLPRQVGLRLLETVYGFKPQLDQADNVRTEFSLHPLGRGVRNDHTIIWEEERTEPIELRAAISWPNVFSRLIGDKAFGLLLADALELPVPATTVMARRVAPFHFGRSTGTGEYWFRTCPREPAPGRFTTRRGWIDPFKLMALEDPEATDIASVLSQEGVGAAYSGAAAADRGMAARIIEGVRGGGQAFMLGTSPPERVPGPVVAAVEDLLSRATAQLGAVRLEWCYDGQRAWVLQLQQASTLPRGGVVYPGIARIEHHFAVQDGLEALRKLAKQLEGSGEGVVLEGNVGVTSHFGDVLRRAKIPSRIETSERYEAFNADA